MSTPSLPGKSIASVPSSAWLLVLALVTWPDFSVASTLHVPSQYPTIQAALNVAQSGDTVQVAPGRFPENLVWPARNPISLLGAGSQGSVQTVIVGNIGIHSAVVDTATVISQIHVSRGYPGLDLDNCRPKFVDCVIDSSLRGADCQGSSPVFDRCAFLHNSSGGAGGGVHLWSCPSPIIRNCLFYANYAASGGAMRITYSSPVLRNTVFAENTAMQGGAIYTNVAGPTFVKCTLVGNRSVPGGDFRAGAMVAGEVTLVMTSCTITANRSWDDFSADAIGLIGPNSQQVHDCNFSNNGIAYISSGGAADASACWWGDPTGPYCSQNPGGLGDTCVVSVLEPWLSDASTVAPPIQPQGLQVTAQTGQGGRPGLVWSAVPVGDVAGYRVYYDTDQEGYPYTHSIDVGNVTDCVLDELEDGVTYHLAVTCYDLSGEESWCSTSVSVTPPVSGIPELTSGPRSLFTSPNPFQDGTTICFESDVAGGYAVDVLDVSGRLIRTLRGIGEPGSVSVRWDGNDSMGKPAQAGVYYIRVPTSSGTAQIARTIAIR